MTTYITPTISDRRIFALSHFRGLSQSLFAVAGALAWHKPEPSGEIPTTPEVRHSLGSDGALFRLVGHPCLGRPVPFAVSSGGGIHPIKIDSLGIG